MKLLFISDVPLKDPTSGSEQVLYQQVSALRRQRHDVRAISRSGDPVGEDIKENGHPEPGNFHADRNDLPGFIAAHLTQPASIYDRFAESGRFDAIICHQPITFFSLVLKKKLKGIPVLYVFHSPSHEEYLGQAGTNRFRTYIPAAFRRILEKQCLKRAGRYMTLSVFMKEKLKRIHGIEDSRVLVNPGGVDTARFKPAGDRDRIKKELGFPDGKIHLLTIRNLEPRMGLDNLIKAFLFLSKSERDIHLTIGGDGPEKNHLNDLVDACGLKDSVTMKGFIPADQLADHYAAADFFILPTRRLEGFGLVTPESLACGTPVLGTPVGGTLEILSRFDSEFLFSDTSSGAINRGIRNIMGKYSKNSPEYTELRSSCRQFAEKHYSWEKHIRTLNAAIHHLLSEP